MDKKLKNYLTIVYSPEEIGINNPGEWPIADLRKNCIKVRKYNNPGEALNAFAETPCTNSELFDDVFDATVWGYREFIKVVANINFNGDSYEKKGNA